MANVSHTQCLLRKGQASQVTWIPTSFANEGKYVKLKRRGEETWDDGWLVAEAWATMTSAEVNERSQDYKNTRKASDRPRDGGREKLKVK